MHDIRIVLTGGGTGGHINPLAAVAHELKKTASDNNLELNLKFIGSSGGFDQALRDQDVEITEISGAKVRRYASMQNFFEGPKLILGYLQALWHLFWFMPDAVFSKGGSGAVAVVLAARFYRIPVFIHESDSVASTTTKFTSKYAELIFLSFEKTIESLPPKVQGFTSVVGNPIRTELLNQIKDRTQAKANLGLDPERPLMVIMGGSQGSQRINNLILASMKELIEHDIQIFHQTGEKNFAEIAQSLGNFFKSDDEMYAAGYHPTDFIGNELGDVLSAADVIVSRSGGSIFEFAAFGRASILIPLPEAASNHQKINADVYSATGAAVTLEESEISIPLFEKTVLDCLNPGKKEIMEKAALGFAKPDASQKIAVSILTYITNH